MKTTHVRAHSRNIKTPSTLWSEAQLEQYKKEKHIRQTPKEKSCQHVFDDTIGYGVHCVKCGYQPPKGTVSEYVRKTGNLPQEELTFEQYNKEHSNQPELRNFIHYLLIADMDEGDIIYELEKKYNLTTSDAQGLLDAYYEGHIN